MRVTDQFYQSYRNSTPTQKSYLSLAMSLALLIFLVVITYPAVQHILELQKELSDGRKTLDQLEQKATNLDLAAQTYEETKPDFPTIDLALPAGSDVKTYLQKPIESLSSQNHLTMTGLQFTEVPLSLPNSDQVLKSKTIPYSLVLEGSFTDFAKFLGQIEKYIRLTNTDKVELTTLKGNGAVSASLKFSTFYFGDSTSKSTTGGNANVQNGN